MVSQYSEDRIAELVVEQLREIQTSLPELKQLRETKREEAEKKRKKEEENKSSKIQIKIVDHQ